MSQEKSKMPVSRQIRYLRGSRDNWKQNSAKKQQKIRQYEPTIRSLKISRDNWKTRAKEAEQRVKELENQLEKQEEKSSQPSDSNRSEILIEKMNSVRGHHYKLQTIQVCVKQVLEAGNSYRGVSQTMKIFGENFNIESPHFKQKISDYLQSEIALLDDNQTVLATSDVIESIFGKYKCFSQRCPLKDLRSMLLTIPLMTMDLTQDVIKKALETVRGVDLSQWVKDVFGPSMF